MDIESTLETLRRSGFIVEIKARDTYEGKGTVGAPEAHWQVTIDDCESAGATIQEAFARALERLERDQAAEIAKLETNMTVGRDLLSTIRALR